MSSNISLSITLRYGGTPKACVSHIHLLPVLQGKVDSITFPSMSLAADDSDASRNARACLSLSSLIAVCHAKEWGYDVLLPTDAVQVSRQQSSEVACLSPIFRDASNEYGVDYRIFLDLKPFPPVKLPVGSMGTIDFGQITSTFLPMLTMGKQRAAKKEIEVITITLLAIPNLVKRQLIIPQQQAEKLLTLSSPVNPLNSSVLSFPSPSPIAVCDANTPMDNREREEENVEFSSVSAGPTANTTIATATREESDVFQVVNDEIPLDGLNTRSSRVVDQQWVTPMSHASAFSACIVNDATPHDCHRSSSQHPPCFVVGECDDTASHRQLTTLGGLSVRSLSTDVEDEAEDEMTRADRDSIAGSDGDADDTISASSFAVLLREPSRFDNPTTQLPRALLRVPSQQTVPITREALDRLGLGHLSTRNPASR